MNTMPKLDDVLQRALWSEMKDPAEFRAYLERAGYEILPRALIIVLAEQKLRSS